MFIRNVMRVMSNRNNRNFFGLYTSAKYSNDKYKSFSDEVAQEIAKKYGNASKEELDSPEIQEDMSKIAAEVRQKHMNKYIESMDGGNEYKIMSQNVSPSKIDSKRNEQIKMRSKKEQEERKRAAEMKPEKKKGPQVVVLKRD
jgi:hypothetical protein